RGAWPECPTARIHLHSARSCLSSPWLPTLEWLENALHEKLDGQSGATSIEFGQTLGADAGRVKVSLGNAVVLDARLHELEQVVHRENSPLHAGNLRDGNDLPPAAGEAGELNDQGDRGRDKFADGPGGNVLAPQADHQFDPAQGIARRVPVDGGQAA